MKRYVKSTGVYEDEKTEIIEEYLRKYCPQYLGSKNKTYMVNTIIKEFESGINPFRRNSSEYNDSMAQVWESYRRKYMK